MLGCHLDLCAAMGAGQGGTKVCCAPCCSPILLLPLSCRPSQYLSFMSLENNLFSLGLPDTYVQLNDPTAQDQQIEVGSSSHDELVV